MWKSSVSVGEAIAFVGKKKVYTSINVYPKGREILQAFIDKWVEIKLMQLFL